VRARLVACLVAALAGCASPPDAGPPADPPAEATEAAAPAVQIVEPGAEPAAEQAAVAPAPVAETPCFVFIHGWSNDARVWMEVAPLLADRAQWIALDLPGHGPSPAPADGDYSLDAQAAAVASAMDARGVTRAVLVGHGAGALVARQFYRRWAERVRGLVIVDGSLASFPGRSEYVEDLARRLEGAERADALEETFLGIPLAGLGEFHRSLVWEMLERTAGATQAATLRATLTPQAYAEDPIAAPVVIVMANAPFWGEEYRTYVQALCPDLRAEWWSGVSHWLMLERPREFAALLDDPRFAARD
jgi:pimeloyl-ACP methyl ester carboxylesterase